MRGRTSVQLASVHSRRSTSVSLLTGNGLATVLVCGNVRLRLSNPYAIATSSMMSHSCRMSGRVGGTWTWISSSGSMMSDAWALSGAKPEPRCAVGALAVWPILRRSVTISSLGSLRPVHELM